MRRGRDADGPVFCFGLGFRCRADFRPPFRPSAVPTGTARASGRSTSDGRQALSAMSLRCCCASRISVSSRTRSGGDPQARRGRARSASRPCRAGFEGGTADIRQLLIIGAMSRLNWLGRRSISKGSWLAHMLARKPRMLVAIALANKMARAIWASLRTNEDYRNTASAAAA